MGKETYFVIEQFDIGSPFRVSEIFFDAKDFRIVVQSLYYIDRLKDFHFPAGSNKNIFIALNSGNASTVEKVTNIYRSKHNSVVDNSEREDIVFKSLLGFIEQHRKLAAENMNVSEADIILAGIEILDIKADGRNVVSLEGIRGREISLKLRGTFINRDALLLLGKIKYPVRVVERFGAVTSFVPKEGAVVNCSNLNTYVFKVGEKGLAFAGKYDWGLNNILKIIKDFFGVSEQNARTILKKILDNQVSSKIINAIEKRASNYFSRLNKIISRLSPDRKKSSRVYLNMPKSLFEKLARRKINKKVLLLEPKKMLQSKGFDVIIKSMGSDPVMGYDFLLIAGSFIFSNNYSKEEEIIKRRSRWLMPETISF